MPCPGGTWSMNAAVVLAAAVYPPAEAWLDAKRLAAIKARKVRTPASDGGGTGGEFFPRTRSAMGLADGRSPPPSPPASAFSDADDDPPSFDADEAEPSFRGDDALGDAPGGDVGAAATGSGAMDDDDFDALPVVPLGDKKLRACMVTGLVKTEDQASANGPHKFPLHLVLTVHRRLLHSFSRRATTTSPV